MIPRTSASSLGPPECHPGDGPGMKPIFDGVYINQILLQAQVPSALQRILSPFLPPSLCFSLYFSLSFPSLSSSSSSPHHERTHPDLPRALYGPIAEWPFKTELKRGSIFIRRFLMKHFKCMKLAVAPPGCCHAFVDALALPFRSPFTRSSRTSLRS